MYLHENFVYFSHSSEFPALGLTFFYSNSFNLRAIFAQQKLKYNYKQMWLHTNFYMYMYVIETYTLVRSNVCFNIICMYIYTYVGAHVCACAFSCWCCFCRNYSVCMQITGTLLALNLHYFPLLSSTASCYPFRIGYSS